MKLQNYLKMKFPAKSANEAFARITVAAFSAQLDPTIDEISDLKTAVSEAVTNCVVHAYRNSEKLGDVLLTAKIYEGNYIQVTIKDYGCGIADVKQAMEPCFTTGGADERSGMGFTIMETFMDKLRVASKEGKGTRVTMLKKISEKL